MSDTDRLTHLIVEFYDKLSSWEHSVVRDKGLTLAQVHTLEILGIHRAMRMKELAEKMGVTTGTLTVMVDRLEKNELVRRRPHESDRRSILVELTDAGHEHFLEHDKLHKQLTEDITSALSEEERSSLAMVLEKMNREF
ncbi:MarR family winged helix-turn-helix transcriptional regulator [Salidesulfovibrio onnuriiensis]|uniref:MarR family winged helix-turn-helix transcriptional regulator n=1 Tax=Salidesulfovibrio onnuriiensis TaxID=2583823 RepID=UPI0011C8A893|nr:MarR family transcriptional regulator [Salidesulfovibrio onnuriiensis]